MSRARFTPNRWGSGVRDSLCMKVNRAGESRTESRGLTTPITGNINERAPRLKYDEFAAIFLVITQLDSVYHMGNAVLTSQYSDYRDTRHTPPGGSDYGRLPDAPEYSGGRNRPSYYGAGGFSAGTS
ncbi:uncharacterized protein FOMMEDRAFT_160479 [Fomitiporia mediterranea MF3/22]|uniref:uncharacterized protein n=1 Tax=Fomitiporia mediterranea (strain MF3/22) TaxID=694068 RepID=UPI0004408C51|nr:uncharacterized protein FOMMEDRAFT_160479 [Fomitiporia mediterranea MF3/22]EJC99431.1 hypothetical protein FOMMEDRAFT_160479 [Fomitiporia mediterranea MF3/22]